MCAFLELEIKGADSNAVNEIHHTLKKRPDRCS